jgi:hypothetical protein
MNNNNNNKKKKTTFGAMITEGIYNVNHEKIKLKID